MIEELILKIINNDRLAISKAITLIESNARKHKTVSRELLKKLPRTPKGLKLGVTGTPGVGKSTLIEKLGICALSYVKKLAVLAIDPTSPVSKGAVLGDKTRMKQLSASDNVFVRPSPSGGSYGGLSKNTKNITRVFDAAGFDLIIIETVGIGQLEYKVTEIADITIFVIQPNLGDELQASKKGAIELADLILINKIDDFSMKTLVAIENSYKTYFSKTPIISISALFEKNIEKTWEAIEKIKSQRLKL